MSLFIFFNQKKVNGLRKNSIFNRMEIFFIYYRDIIL